MHKISPEEPKRSRFRPTRRGFLIAGGASIGLVVGYALWPRQYPNAWAPGQGETLLGPWIKISTEGQVTVACPQAEMGQGVMSGFAQIVADELGADWMQMAVEPAPWHPAYANVALAAAGTASLPAMVRPFASKLGGEAIRRMNLHLTGGSMSIMNYHDILRRAAAEARARLIHAAAGEWGVSADELDTANGYVVYKANRLSFAEAVRLVDPESDPPSAELRPVSSRRLEGKTLLRIDIPSKVDGSARFGADVRVPGLLYAAVRHGPVAGSLKSAQAPDGVQMVKGPNWVAAVSRTNWAAQQALDKIETSFAVAGQKAGPWIQQALAKAALAEEGGKAVIDEGDLAEAFSNATVIVQDYSVPFLAHACMEPMTATARITEDRAEIWGPTQSLTIAHAQVADALGFKKDNVIVYPTLVGGGFGRKAEADCMVEAALIAKAVGKPVQVTWSREEDFGQGRFRPPVQARMRGAVRGGNGADAGRIAGWDARVAAPDPTNSFARRNVAALASDNDKASAAAIEGLSHSFYAIPAFRAVHVPMDQPVPLGFWRSVGNSFSAFMVESFIDELAAAAGKDPLAFRLSHLADKPRHTAVLKAAAEAANWGEPVDKGFGRGIALHESFGSIAAMVVEAGLVEGRIRIKEAVVVLDCGRAITPDAVRAQMEGSAIMGLSAAIGESITFEEGQAQERNFHSYPVMQMSGSPERLTTVIVTSGAALGGVGEPALPPAAPALANALAVATGRRARSLPLLHAYAS